jgi:hypothetical protein
VQIPASGDLEATGVHLSSPMPCCRLPAFRATFKVAVPEKQTTVRLLTLAPVGLEPPAPPVTVRVHYREPYTVEPLGILRLARTSDLSRGVAEAEFTVRFANDVASSEIGDAVVECSAEPVRARAAVRFVAEARTLVGQVALLETGKVPAAQGSLRIPLLRDDLPDLQVPWVFIDPTCAISGSVHRPPAGDAFLVPSGDVMEK